MSKSKIGDNKTTYPSLLDKEWNFNGTIRFLNGAKKRLAMTKDDFDNYRVIGGNCDHKGYDENNVKVWRQTKRQPSRPEVQRFPQMIDIAEGTRGKYKDWAGNVLLKVQCLCGQEVSKYSLINNVKLQWERAIKEEILVGNCCILKFISPDAFDKMCECCRKVKVKGKKKYICNNCEFKNERHKHRMQPVFKELKKAVRVRRRGDDYTLVRAVNRWDKQWEDEKRLKCTDCPVLLGLDNPEWKNKCRECWKKEQCTKHGEHTCGCGKMKFSWDIYCKSCFRKKQLQD